MGVTIELLPKRSSNAVAFTIDFECRGISVPSSLDEKDVGTAQRRRFSSNYAQIMGLAIILFMMVECHLSAFLGCFSVLGGWVDASVVSWQHSSIVLF